MIKFRKILPLLAILSSAWVISWANEYHQISSSSRDCSSSPSDNLFSFFSEEKGVQIRVQPSNSFAVRGIKNDLSVSFEVRTGEIDKDTPRRNPINLAIVLDKSGSMSGDKIQNSIQAILKTLDYLDERDRVHLVAYDSSVQIVFEDKNAIEDSSLLKRLVSSISPGTATNLWGGMEKAAKLLKKYNKEGYENRVMLFSDGLVNSGETNSERIISNVGRVFLEELNAKVSSFGIGVGFNEFLMKEISLIGQGKYFFIENSVALPQFVEHSLDVLAQPLLYDVKLRILGMNGAVVREVFGHENIASGAHLGDIGANNVRTVLSLIDFNLPGGREDQSDEPPSIFEFVRFEFEYRHRGETEPRILRGRVSIQATDDPHVVEENQNDRVVAERMVAETSRMDFEIKEALERGEEEEAMKIQNKEIEVLQEAANLDVEGTANTAILLDSALGMKKRLETGGAKSASNLKRYHQSAYVKLHPDRQYSSNAFQSED
mmetsp:Transcript_26767/g.37279  ORF Transcript_26767/g.37279 Transcript_26767/m.37279 type:complete len:490 (+) Transcript_26767:145-1614(+)